MAVTISVRVNGAQQQLDVDPRMTLVDLLRDRLHLTGTKIGCNRGECGACTVHIDGRQALACLTLAVLADQRSVTTIEGLSDAAGNMHPMQRAFVANDAFQCGYCTSGQIMSAVACVTQGHASNEADIREFMSGNICRCGAYANIVSAIRSVAGG